MKEYIERESVMKAFADYVWNSNHSDLVPAPQWNHAVDIVRDFPAADVVEVRRGRWIDGLDVPKEEQERHPYVYLSGEKHCSVCYKEAYYDTDYGQQLFDYCPNCGAKMDGGVNDASD